MKKLREIHLYLGCLFAPVLILFAMSGAWQLFGLHRAKKDGSYRPSHFVAMLSDIHQYQHLPSTLSQNNTPLRFFILAAAIGLIVTTILGVVMALRYGHNRTWAIVCLLVGIGVPVAFLLIYR